MNVSEIECLKDNIDKLVEIRTVGGECLIARVLFVTHDDEFDEHDVIYQVISSSKIDSYSNLETTGGYVLGFEEIVSVAPAPS